ncbi:MAG: DUF1588 domain-containing protein [Phycisphaeraceae bacterium]
MNTCSVKHELHAWWIAALILVVLSPVAIAAAEPVPDSLGQFKAGVAPLLTRYCAECHDAQKPKGELDLITLDPDMKASTSAARWAMVHEKLSLGKMPPKNAKLRPSAEETATIMAWIKAEMKRSGKHLAKREAYANGNLVPHELLFDPKQSAPFEAVARVRRLSPEIYAGFLGEVAKGASNVGNPFSPEGKNTFKDMGDPKIDEPVAALLIRNALAIVERQTAYKLEDGVVKSVGFSPREFLALFDEKNPATETQMAAAVKLQYERVLKRQPTAEESTRLVALMKMNIADAGRETGVRHALAAVLLTPEAVFRMEVGGGAASADGRVRLSPREIAFALAYALTDRRPDDRLLEDAAKGRLDTAEGVAAAVSRMLADPKLQKPRILRFFREYFGYDQATEVFKNDKDNPEHEARSLVEDTDRLVLYILDQDKDVLKELLTTNKSFVAYKTAADTKKKRIAELAKFEDEKAKNPEKFKTKKPPKVGRSVYESYNLSDFPDVQPVELPREQRAGILTQPAWLVAWSKSDDNDVIHRGKWVRERLLGGVVPDIPITVDAQLPIAPEQTLRERMAVTHQEYCWKCHQLMNRTGYPFEMYDHFGRFRTEEIILDPDATAKNVDKKGKPLGNVMRGVPVDGNGSFDLVHGDVLKGPMNGAVEFVHAMAKSPYVEQIFVRHAFRYWMGRNENLGDGPSLQRIHRAYRESGGSMQALITAIVTSDSFLYRMQSASGS